MGSVLQGQKTGDEYILYLHDENGNTYGFLLKNGTTEEYYYYIFNAQGDVIGILDSAGTQVVAYEYSAWGEILSITGSAASTIGTQNPIRYRGYYYDSETGFYYCNSRYYDPETCRWINADIIAGAIGYVNGNNMFVYCFNCPILLQDKTGAWPSWREIVEAVVDTTLKIASNIVGFSNPIISSIIDVSVSNYVTNSEIEANEEMTTKNRIISNQNNDAAVKNIRYGLFSASYNSCEAIAIHNAKVIKGIDSTLTGTIEQVQAAGGMWLQGVFGSKPSSIPKVLTQCGISFTKVKPENMVLSGTYIVSYWNEGAPWNGIHTVTVTYDGSTYNAINGPSNFQPTQYRCIVVYYLE